MKRSKPVPVSVPAPASAGLFLGSQPAMDFLNTAYGPAEKRVEVIGDGRAFLDWLVGAGLITEQVAAKLPRRFGQEALDAAAAEARKVREWARAWLTRWRDAPRRDYGDELAVLNELLAREARHREVIAAGRDLRLADHARLDSADSLLALIAAAIAELVSSEHASLVRSCAGTDCTLWFLDRTKAHRRLFCSASACGNRAKVAAFRERQRE